MGARYTLPVAAKIGAWREARGMAAGSAIFGEEEESIIGGPKRFEIFSCRHFATGVGLSGSLKF
jgi:hypothetical protein